MSEGLDYVPITDDSLLELKKIIDQAFDDISGDTNKGLIQSHKYPAWFSTCVLGEDGWPDDDDYEIVGYTISYMAGCGCPQGIKFVIKKVS